MSLFDKVLDVIAGKEEKRQEVGKGRIKKALIDNQPPTVQPQTTSQSPPLDLERQAREIILEAKDEAFRVKREAEEEARRIRSEVLALEAKIAQREETLETKLASVGKKEEEISLRARELDEKLEEQEKKRQELIAKLEKIATLTQDEAKKLILENIERQLKDEIAKKIKEAQDQARTEAQEKVKEIIVEAMTHGATDYVAEFTASTITLPNEEMKGRIIGKEGRNIRAFEMATGVDVELDTGVPNEIRLSSFDPVRREIAKLALERLVRDGRIQPERIESFVKRAKEDVEKDMAETGRKVAYEAGIYNLEPEVLDLFGRLKFRLSYGQNQLAAALETSKIAKKLAAELGADQQVTSLSGLLHDIGKAVTEKEGTHVQLGVEFLKKKNFPQKVIDCVAQHHEDEPFTSLESVIVHIADAISGARPGARHEGVEEYTKRLSELEKVAKSFDGVDEVFAIQAGREVRVIVKPQEIDDSQSVKLSHDIAQKIEKEVTYPGQVKVTVIREVRAEDFAKAA